MTPKISHAPYAPRPAERPLDRTLVRAFLENVPDAVYFKDRDSRFIAVSRSKAQRHGMLPEQLLGRNDDEFFTQDHARRARAEEESIMATGQPILGKVHRITWTDGRQGWGEVTKLPLRDLNGEIIGTFGVTKDITEAEEMRAKLEQAHRSLLETSRTAGMAEVATGVLHNVGNVLTSLNVSASVIATGLGQSKAESLAKVSALLQEHASDLGQFVAYDPKGHRVPEFLESLSQHLLEERDRLLREIASLQENIDHIKEIVSMQQSYATMVGVVEALDPAALLEDALRMNASALVRHDVSVVRQFTAAPRVRVEKGKVLQILINLIRNAKYAADEGHPPEKIVTVGVEPAGDFVRLIVQDNGIGIPAENLEKLFTHGFTTRSGGHGFGLHSSAIVAREMKGSLTAHSEGVGRGATFILALPVAKLHAN
jgi:PAS domain S-box-containing protein